MTETESRTQRNNHYIKNCYDLPCVFEGALCGTSSVWRMNTSTTVVSFVQCETSLWHR